MGWGGWWGVKVRSTYNQLNTSMQPIKRKQTKTKQKRKTKDVGGGGGETEEEEEKKT